MKTFQFINDIELEPYKQVCKIDDRPLFCQPKTIRKKIRSRFYDNLYHLVKHRMNAHSFAYVRGKSDIQAVQYANKTINSGFNWVGFIDLKSAYENINHELLIHTLSHNLSLDDKYTQAIKGYIKAPYLKDSVLYEHNYGLYQGAVCSPLLFNCFLTPFDDFCSPYASNNNWYYLRSADDMFMFFRDRDYAEQWVRYLSDKLRNEFKLEINTDKSGVYSPEELNILGFTHVKHGNHYSLIPKQKTLNKHLHKIHKLLNKYPSKKLPNVSKLLSKLHKIIPPINYRFQITHDKTRLQHTDFCSLHAILHRILSVHTDLPERRKEITRIIPDDNLVDILVKNNLNTVYSNYYDHLLRNTTIPLLS